MEDMGARAGERKCSRGGTRYSFLAYLPTGPRRALWNFPIFRNFKLMISWLQVSGSKRVN